MEMPMVPNGESVTISSARQNKITPPPIRMSGNFSNKDDENNNKTSMDFNQMLSKQDTGLGDPMKTRIGNESVELEALIDKGPN